MNTNASKVGGIFGFIGVASLVIWLWQAYYDEIFTGRLSIEARQTLLRLQRQLPIEIEHGIFLDRYDVNRGNVSFTFRVDFIEYSEFEQNKVKNIVESNTHRWICGWRKSFPEGSSRFAVDITIIDLNRKKIASVSNKLSDCVEYRLAPIVEEST